MQVRGRRFSIGQILLVILLFALTMTMLIPLLNILAKSLSSPTGSMEMSGLDIIPHDLDFTNYRIVFSHPILVPALINSVIITVVGTAINMILTVTAAYVLTRPRLALKRHIMVFLIIMLLFDPGTVTEYLVVQNLGLMGRPKSIVEAAEIDGAGHLKSMTSVYIPLAKSGIATITMFYAVVRWNEYFKASIYLTEKSTDTVLQVVLRQFVVLGDVVSILGQQNVFDYNTLARVDYAALKGATIVVAIVPILILYPFVLKFYTKDVMGGGIKE